MKVFVIDVAKCSGCYNCQIACKDEHCGNDWPPYAKPQPETGHFWMRVTQEEHGQVPTVRVEYPPWPCMHCEDPKCGRVAPDAVDVRDDGLVIIDPERAVGRRELVDACPYGAVFYNEELDVPQKCTGCAHLVDEGKLPHCVDLCATGALRFGDEEEFADELLHAETYLLEEGCRPRVFYLNRPYLFLAGDVWDPACDEIVEGARVTLAMLDGTVRKTVTDDFGDFYFRKLDEGVYDVAVEADGYRPVERRGIELKKSLNLGDFALVRA